jgi:mono/diheme cytochrome c family protein
MTRIRVAFFESPTQAGSFRQRLRQSGIAAEVHDESALARLWFVPKTRAGSRLEVPERDFERANLLLLEWGGEPDGLRGVIRCPECGSLRADYPQFTPRSLLTNLVMGLMAEIGLVEREYYCEDCHCMWPRPGSQPRRPRPHMAPDYFLEDVKHQPERLVDEPGPEPGDSRFRHALVRRAPHNHNAPALLVVALVLLLSSPTRLLAADTPARGTIPIVAPQAGQPTFLRDVLPIFMGKCARCHNDQSPFMLNWLDYRTASAHRWEIKRRVWDSWNGAYFKQPMPTGNSPESTAMTDEERTIILKWVKSGAACGVQPVLGSAESRAERLENGKRLFATICAACHQPAGQGIPGRFPPLAGSDFLNSDKRRAIKTVLNGLQGDVLVNGQKFNNSMPRFPLSDADIASALTYVYDSFGNSGKDVTPAEVGAARAERDDLDAAAQSQTAKIPRAQNPYE